MTIQINLESADALDLVARASQQTAMIKQMLVEREAENGRLRVSEAALKKRVAELEGLLVRAQPSAFDVEVKPAAEVKTSAFVAAPLVPIVGAPTWILPPGGSLPPAPPICGTSAPNAGGATP
jgi:hypothetical protein